MGNVFSPKHKWRKTVRDTTIQENVKKQNKTKTCWDKHAFKMSIILKEKTFKWMNSKIQYKL